MREKLSAGFVLALEMVKVRPAIDRSLLDVPGGILIELVGGVEVKSVYIQFVK